VNSQSSYSYACIPFPIAGLPKKLQKTLNKLLPNNSAVQRLSQF